MFIDSSDDHYIFSLSFKLNGGVRHVRIEHDHGNSTIIFNVEKLIMVSMVFISNREF